VLPLERCGTILVRGQPHAWIGGGDRDTWASDHEVQDYESKLGGTKQQVDSKLSSLLDGLCGPQKVA